MGSTISTACGETSAENGGVVSVPGLMKITSVASFRSAVNSARSYHEVIEAAKTVTDPSSEPLVLAHTDWQNALRKAGPHADSLLRIVECSSVHEHELDEGCYHIVVISLVQLAMKTPSSDTGARLLEDALGVIMTMERRALNKAVGVAYQAVVHAASVTNRHEIADKAKRLQHENISSGRKHMPLVVNAHNPPLKLNLDDNNFSQTPADSLYGPTHHGDDSLFASAAPIFGPDHSLESAWPEEAGHVGGLVADGVVAALGPGMGAFP